jgi:hypothetical protein
MRLRIASLVLGPFLLTATLPAIAAPSAGFPILLADSGNSTGDQESYRQASRIKMQEWQKKLQDFGEDAESTGEKAGDAADHDLSEAWAKTKDASRRLQAAGADGWESAKASFESASRELSETWHRLHPEDH